MLERGCDFVFVLRAELSYSRLKPLLSVGYIGLIILVHLALIHLANSLLKIGCTTNEENLNSTQRVKISLVLSSISRVAPISAF